MSDIKSPSGPPPREPSPVDASPAYDPNPDSSGTPMGGMPPVRFGLAAADMNTGPVAQPPNGMIANHPQPGTGGFRLPHEGSIGYTSPDDPEKQADPSRGPSYSPPPQQPQAPYFGGHAEIQDGQVPQMQPQFTGGFQHPQPGQQMPYMQSPMQSPPPGQYQQPMVTQYAASPQVQSPQVQSPQVQGVAAVQPVVGALNPLCAQQGHRPVQPTPVCGILWAILCFPFGLICLFSELGKPPVCGVCGVEVPGGVVGVRPAAQQYVQPQQQQQFAQQQQYAPQQQYMQPQQFQMQQQPQAYQQPPQGYQQQPFQPSPAPATPGK